ncbi:MAG TPA: ATP-binding cassette domain-containing protein [bacterium]|nr:ATP-binding cassette domain-containing protein [bacterium]HOL47190.1 ATP-binding cassette domain-containing protein [bacterium]HPQ17682.1 ATP-binding cassette domain-containing protein [bacterium]
MIKFINVCKEYKNNKILNDINFEINKSEFVFITGSYGKSTILKLIYLIEKPDSGLILVKDENINNYNFRKMQNYRKNIGFFSDELKILKDRNVYENLEFPLKLNKIKKKERKEKIENLLEKFELTKIYEKKYNEISNSERIKTLICRAIITEPELILLDEATAGLSENDEQKIMMYLYELKLKKESTIIFATNLQRILQNKCDKIIYLKDSEIIRITKGYVPELNEINLEEII